MLNVLQCAVFQINKINIWGGTLKSEEKEETSIYECEKVSP